MALSAPRTMGDSEAACRAMGNCSCIMRRLDRTARRFINSDRDRPFVGCLQRHSTMVSRFRRRELVRSSHALCHGGGSNHWRLHSSDERRGRSEDAAEVPQVHHDLHRLDADSGARDCPLLVRREPEYLRAQLRFRGIHLGRGAAFRGILDCHLWGGLPDWQEDRQDHGGGREEPVPSTTAVAETRHAAQDIFRYWAGSADSHPDLHGSSELLTSTRPFPSRLFPLAESRSGPCGWCSNAGPPGVAHR